MPEQQQNNIIFTKKRALLGLAAYLVFALVLVAVFI